MKQVVWAWVVVCPLISLFAPTKGGVLLGGLSFVGLGMGLKLHLRTRKPNPIQGPLAE